MNGIQRAIAAATLLGTSALLFAMYPDRSYSVAVPLPKYGDVVPPSNPDGSFQWPKSSLYRYVNRPLPGTVVGRFAIPLVLLGAGLFVLAGYAGLGPGGRARPGPAVPTP